MACITIKDVVTGVLGNFVFWLLFVVVAFVVFKIAKRKPLFSFFGIGDEKVIRIYISNLSVVAAADQSGTPRNYRGQAVVHNELLEATKLAKVFSALLPGFADKPGLLGSLSLSDVDAQILPAPPKQNTITSSSFVTVGSPGYNDVSGLVQSSFKSPIRFIEDNAKFSIGGVGVIGNPRQSFICRIPNGKNFIFYVGGLGEGGTCAALYYLRTHWNELHREFIAKPCFYVLVEIQGVHYEHCRAVARNELHIP
jgi:hypothetical protein